MTATNLRSLRLRARLRQNQLARRLGVAPVTVWRWEHRRAPISKAMAIAITAICKRGEKIGNHKKGAEDTRQEKRDGKHHPQNSGARPGDCAAE